LLLVNLTVRKGSPFCAGPSTQGRERGEQTVKSAREWHPHVNPMRIGVLWQEKHIVNESGEVGLSTRFSRTVK
jgi:hypothetical protein